MKKIISIVLMVLVLMDAFACVCSAQYEDLEYLQSLDLDTPKVTNVRNGDYGVYITFTKIEHATRYNVYMKVKGGSWQPFNYVVMEETDDKMVVLDQMNVGKKAGTTYYYTVKAFVTKGDATRESKYDKVGKSVKYIDAPYPSNVYNNHSGNKVSWGKSNGADGYYLYRKTPSTSYKKIATIKKGSTTSYLDKNIKSGQKYTYTVKAYKGKLVSSYFKNGVTISPAEKVNSPVITTKNVTGGKRVYISSGNERDVIFYKIGKNGTYKQYTRDFGLTSTQTVYAYVARTKCYKSETVSKKIVVTKAKAPTISFANCIGGKKITLKTTTPNATLYYKTSKDGSYVQYTGAFVVSSSKTIYAKTMAKGYATSGTVSAKVSVSKLSAPTLSSVKADNDIGKVTLKWKTVSGAQGYYVYRADELNTTYELVAKVPGGKTVSYIDYDYSAGLKNYYKIRAYCSGKATSSYSSVKSVQTVGYATSDEILSDPLGAYQKAANKIATTGTAGYAKKSWQNIESDIQLSKHDFLEGTLTNLIEGFMTTEDQSEEKIYAKGSQDAMNCMPASDCSDIFVKNTTVRQSGGNYIIKIVMNKEINPSYDDSDGLALMSKDFLDYKDVKKTIENDESIKQLINDIDGTITYEDYTIVATMNSKGQFIEIEHYGIGNIEADMNLVAVGDTSAVCSLSFHTIYSNFQY